jgi:hypothetical protein
MPLVKLKSGAIKEVSAKDAKLLVLVKRATLVAEEPESKTDEQGDDKPKRAYKTKVLKAEK